jgi:YD repeat-containing protein
MPVAIDYIDNGTKKEGYALTFDKRGYITKESIYRNYDTPSTTIRDYTYDEIGQLLKVVNNANSKTTTNTYTYDKVGNRATMTNGTDKYVYTYNQFNNLTQTTKNAQIQSSFKYDLNGNQTQEIDMQTINGTTKDVTTDSALNVSNGKLALSQTTTGSHWATQKIKVKPNTNYYISANCTDLTASHSPSHKVFCVSS